VLLPASKIHTNTLSVTSSSMPAGSPYSTNVNTGSPAVGPSTPGGLSHLGPLPQEEDQWLINPAFESHLRDLNNWSLGPSFRGTFPQFADCVKIKRGR
jgi:hypothetical protein